MELVYNGFDNENVLRIKELSGGSTAPFDFSGASSIELYIPALDMTIDSGIDWGDGDGVVKFTLGGSAIPEGTYYGRLVVFDPLHPNGQILVHELSKTLQLRVKG